MRERMEDGLNIRKKNKKKCFENVAQNSRENVLHPKYTSTL